MDCNSRDRFSEKSFLLFLLFLVLAAEPSETASRCDRYVVKDSGYWYYQNQQVTQRTCDYEFIPTDDIGRDSDVILAVSFLYFSEVFEGNSVIIMPNGEELRNVKTPNYSDESMETECVHLVRGSGCRSKTARRFCSPESVYETGGKFDLRITSHAMTMTAHYMFFNCDGHDADKKTTFTDSPTTKADKVPVNRLSFNNTSIGVNQTEMLIDEDLQNKFDTLMTIAIVLGVLLLVVIFFLVFLCLKRRLRQRKSGMGVSSGHERTSSWEGCLNDESMATTVKYQQNCAYGEQLPSRAPPPPQNPRQQLTPQAKRTASTLHVPPTLPPMRPNTRAASTATDPYLAPLVQLPLPLHDDMEEEEEQTVYAEIPSKEEIKSTRRASIAKPPRSKLVNRAPSAYCAINAVNK